MDNLKIPLWLDEKIRYFYRRSVTRKKLENNRLWSQLKNPSTEEYKELEAIKRTVLTTNQ